MNNSQISSFKYVSLILLGLFLGACSAPGYAPVVEDLGVQARVSERIAVLPTSTSVSKSDDVVATVEPTVPVVAAPSKLYVQPESTVTVTAQPASKSVETQSMVQEVVPQEVQNTPLPASDQTVVEQLLADADKLKAQGKETQAIIQLQRAQRIAPREPKVYARLAALQLSLGEAFRAEQLALKGLTLVPNKKTYQYYFWKLIAASRSYLADRAGEAKAIVQAEKYK